MRADLVGPKVHVPPSRRQQGVHIRRERAQDAGNEAGPKWRRLPPERRHERLAEDRV